MIRRRLVLGEECISLHFSWGCLPCYRKCAWSFHDLRKPLEQEWGPSRSPACRRHAAVPVLQSTHPICTCRQLEAARERFLPFLPPAVPTKLYRTCCPVRPVWSRIDPPRSVITLEYPKIVPWIKAWVLFCGIDWGENLDLVNNSAVEFALFEGCLLDHLTECASVQTVELSGRLADDAGSSRSIVHKS